MERIAFLAALFAAVAAFAVAGAVAAPTAVVI